MPNMGNAPAVALAANPTADDSKNSRLVFFIDIAFSWFVCNNVPAYDS
jgi:hypothetical protein